MKAIIIFQHFYSVFQAKNQEPHDKCPLHASRDLYWIQEGNKTQEYAAKWVCNFCGKAFYSEHYLDKHFENKHSDKLVKVRTVIFYSIWCLLNAFHCFVLKRGGQAIPWWKLFKVLQRSLRIFMKILRSRSSNTLDCQDLQLGFFWLFMGVPLQFVQ